MVKASFATFRYGQISYSVTGRGRTVVLLHGFLGAKEIWQETALALSRSYRVVCVDLPGHGASDHFGYVHSMDLMARSVKAVLDHLRLRRYVLIGHSMGGYVSLAFAELFPENVKGLGLVHATAYADTDLRKRDRERTIELVKANRKLYTSSTIRNLFARENAKYLKKEISFAVSLAARTPKRGIAAALLGMKDRPARDVILALANYPVLVIIGARDPMVPSDQLIEQSKLLRHPVVEVLDHDAHFGFIESPKRCVKAMRKLLRMCYR